jgi:hypothetical protein
MGCHCSQPVPDKIISLQRKNDEDDNNSKSNINVPQNDESSVNNKVKAVNPAHGDDNSNNNNNTNSNEIKICNNQNEQQQTANVAVVAAPQEIQNGNEQHKEQVKLEEKKKPKVKYDITNYPIDALALINQIRNDPPKYAEEVEKAISNIKTEQDKLVYAGKLKVLLHKGEVLFREVIQILKNTPHMTPLIFNNDIAIECPRDEIEIKDPKVFQNKIIEKRKQLELNAYFKDAIKDPYISILLMIVDDSINSPGKKRESLLNPEFKYIAITSTMINKVFCAYYTFSK